jgi:hypothetical protein
MLDHFPTAGSDDDHRGVPLAPSGTPGLDSLVMTLLCCFVVLAVLSVTRRQRSAAPAGLAGCSFVGPLPRFFLRCPVGVARGMTSDIGFWIFRPPPNPVECFVQFVPQADGGRNRTPQLQRCGPPASWASEAGGVLFVSPFSSGSARGTALLTRSVFTSTFCLGRGLMSL